MLAKCWQNALKFLFKKSQKLKVKAKAKKTRQGKGKTWPHI